MEAALTAPVFLRTLPELEHHLQHAVPTQAALCSLGPVADGAEGRLNRIGRPQALPVLGREIIKGQQFFAILLQALDGLWVFGFKSLLEPIEGGFGVLLGLRLPDVVQPPLAG